MYFMGQGILEVHVMEEPSMAPLEGARIVLRDLDGKVLHEFVSDANGRVPPMTLEAPDVALTLDPNYTGTPFSLFNMEATKDGFHSMLYRYIEVFDTQTSIQPVIMHRATPDEIARGIKIEHTIDIGSRRPSP